jgi:hypothetical protein
MYRIWTPLYMSPDPAAHTSSARTKKPPSPQPFKANDSAKLNYLLFNANLRRASSMTPDPSYRQTLASLTQSHSGEWIGISRSAQLPQPGTT